MKLRNYALLFLTLNILTPAYAQSKEIVINKKLPDEEKAVILEDSKYSAPVEEAPSTSSSGPFLDIPKITGNSSATAERSAPVIKDEPVVVHRTLRSAKEAGIDPFNENRPQKTAETASSPVIEPKETSFIEQLGSFKNYLIAAVFVLVGYLAYSKKNKVLRKNEEQKN